MAARPTPWVMGVICLGLLGCGSSNPHVRLARDRVAFQKEIHAILAAVMDVATMETAKSRFIDRFDHFQELADRAREVGHPSPVVLERYAQDFEKCRQEFKQALDQTIGELGRIRQLPGGPDFLDQLDQFLPKHGETP